MRQSYTLALCCLLTLLGTRPSPSLAASEPAKVAVINLSKVFDQYRMTKDLEAKFDERRRAMAAEAQKKQDEINVKRQALASFKPGTIDHKTRRNELTEMQMNFEVWAATKEQLMRDSHKDWLLRIYHDVRDAVQTVSKAQNIDLVLTYEEVTDEAPDSKTLRQQLMLEKVFYFDPKLDLTQTVIEEVNKKYGGPDNIDVDISFADPPQRPDRPATAVAAVAPAEKP